MALAALVFMRFGGFGTGENVNPEEFLAYAEPVENITVPESAKIIALGEATHGNAEFQQLKLEVFKLMVKIMVLGRLPLKVTTAVASR